MSMFKLFLFFFTDSFLWMLNLLFLAWVRHTVVA